MDEEKPVITRANLYRILPEHIICDPTDNSRKFAPKHSLDDLIASILEHGQLEPVTVRRNRAGELRCVFGFRRVAAVLKINAEHLAPEPVLATYQVVAATDEQAFTRNLAENLERDDLSPIDKAHAIDKLQVVFGRTGEEIARTMHRSPGWVSQTRRLLDLPQDIQRKIHAGEISASAAYEMLSMRPDQQRRTFNGIIAANGAKGAEASAPSAEPRAQELADRSEREPGPVVTRERVRKVKRGEPASEDEPRTRKQILDFWIDLAASAVPEEREAAQLAEAVVKHHGGELTDRQLLNRIVKAVG